MTLSIPDALFDKYNEACDWFIDNNNIGRVCTLIYPPKRIECDNCLNPVGATSNNVYRHGGPAPFSFGNCSICGGSGYSEQEITGTIRLRVYWSRKDWLKIASSLSIPDADAMGIGYMTDLPTLQKAIEVKLVSDQQQTTSRYRVAGSAQPHGFGRDRYFVVFFKAVE